jgi:hypothetical protein
VRIFSSLAVLLARLQSLMSGTRMERNYGEEVRKITEVPIATNPPP